MKSETCYGLGGQEVEENSALAKKIELQNKTYYFIIFWKGAIHDPYGPYLLKRGDKDLCKLKTVSESAFNLFFKYLKTKNKLYFIQAQRVALTEQRT
jgi:hypothetical protein